MRTRPPARVRSGPFVIPARTLLLVSGLLSLGLGLFNLYHEFHANQVDIVYVTVASGVGLCGLVLLVAAFFGLRIAVFLSGLIAFVEFAIILSTHFVIGPVDIDTFWKSEGLPIATVDMALVPATTLVVVSAAVAWGTPRGRNRRLETLPILVVAVIGAVLVILQATDDIWRADFGRANAEDGTFAAAILATVWLMGALWIARVRRTGALLIAVATFGIAYSFVTLHLVRGGIPVSAIASKSGIAWAYIQAGAAVLAAASCLLSLGILVQSVFRRRARATATKQPVRRGA